MTKYPVDWFKNWFDEWYLKVYQHRDQQEAIKFISHWHIWDSLCAGDHCLDIGCGTGRYTEELVRRGLIVMGLDLSAPLLRIAVNKNEQHLNSNFVRADMRMIPTNKLFPLVLSLFTSFGYFKTDADHLNLMCSIGARIKPGGYLILDLPNPESVFKKVANNPESDKSIDSVNINEKRWIDHKENRVVKKITITDDSTERIYYESIRLFKKMEIEDLLNRADIEPSELWGDYQGGKFKSDSPRMIYFGIKNG